MTTSVTCVAAQGSRTTADLSTLLTPAARELTRQEANQWIKRLRLVPFDGTTMRRRFTYRDDSLWWFTELYLHKMRQLDRAVATVLALEAACRRHEPSRLVIETSDPVVQEAAPAFGRAHKLDVEVRGRIVSGAGIARASYLTGLSATLPRWRGVRRRPARSTRVAAFVHTAFWRTSPAADEPGQESYIGPVLEALRARLPAEALTCVGVGPRRNFRARRWWDPILGAAARRTPVIPVEQLSSRRQLTGALDVWRRRRELAAAVTAGDGIRAAARFRDCDLWPTLRRELEHAAMVQWPWSARVMDEAGAALDRLTPHVAVTYAEAGGWGRALVLEARRRGLPTAALQHGFIYRHWLNYLHEADEILPDGSDRGFPLPDRTLLFDRYAAEQLERTGHFPGSTLRVTGSPRLDELAAKVAALRPHRDDIRREYAVGDDQQLVVLAAKFTEIADALPSVLAAVAVRPDVRLVVKAHPAEVPEVYAPFLKTVQNASTAPADADLARLLAAADGLMTMNSTVAIDCLLLGVPALVLAEPNNLTPFVEAGLMLGAGDRPIADLLGRLLDDLPAREELRRRSMVFTDRFEIRADGLAADRAANEILALAR